MIWQITCFFFFQASTEEDVCSPVQVRASSYSSLVAGQKFNKFQMCVCAHVCLIGGMKQRCIRAPLGTDSDRPPSSSLFSSLTPTVPSHDPLESRDGPIVLFMQSARMDATFLSALSYFNQS